MSYLFQAHIFPSVHITTVKTNEIMHQTSLDLIDERARLRELIWNTVNRFNFSRILFPLMSNEYLTTGIRV